MATGQWPALAWLPGYACMHACMDTLITEHCTATSVGAENNHNPTRWAVRYGAGCEAGTRTQAARLVERGAGGPPAAGAGLLRRAVSAGVAPVDRSALAPAGRRGHGSSGSARNERAGSSCL